MNINKTSDIDLFNLFSMLWKQKKIILISTTLFALIGVVYSLSLADKYKSEAILSPKVNANSVSNMASQYSGLASLAGISIPETGDVDKVAETINIVRSFNFFSAFIENNQIFKEIVAAESWDSVTNEIIYDETIYDSKIKKWVSNDLFSVNGVPSMQSAHRKFLKSLSITKNEKTKLVTLSYEHYSPNFAKQVVDLLILEINTKQKNYDVEIAQKSIEYLNQEANSIQIKGVQDVLNGLIQKQIETIMLANVDDDYLFKILSHPISPELKISPQRALICIVFSTMGLILSCLYILLFVYRKKLNVNTS